MQGRMAYDRFVHHYNEYGYKYGDNKKPQTNNLPVNVWDYYATIGKYRGLIKITQVGDTGFQRDLNHSIYANRKSIYNDGVDGDYTETGVEDEGVKISPDNGAFDNSAVNGYYFPINKVLMYDSGVRSRLGSERIRVDITTMLPEIASNSVRGNGYFRFPNGYFDNITSESSGTILLYLMDAYSPAGGAWRDYQGDEVMVQVFTTLCSNCSSPCRRNIRNSYGCIPQHLAWYGPDLLRFRSAPSCSCRTALRYAPVCWNGSHSLGSRWRRCCCQC